MKLGFMSSVCPKMNVDELIAVGSKHGYVGIEFRPEWGHGHGVELDATTGRRREIASILADGGLEGMCLAPGVKFCSPDRTERDGQQELLSRYIDLAAETRIPRIRVFGDPIPNAGGAKRTACYEHQAECLVVAAGRALDAGITLVLETHMNLRAFDVGEILYRAGYPRALRVNWHLGHCLRHGEDVDEAYRHVKGLVGHAHFSIAEPEAQSPHVERQVELLLGEGYDGYFSLEVIDPDDPEATLVRHADAWRAIRDRLEF